LERIELLEEQIRIFNEGPNHVMRKRGLGCEYAVKPNDLHLAILNVLAENKDGRPMRWIAATLNKSGTWKGTTHNVTSRLSECLGEHQGWVRMSTDHKVVVEEIDGTLTFRYDEAKGRKKPVYFITEKGYEVLRENGFDP
jgi:hypothetical protein